MNIMKKNNLCNRIHVNMLPWIKYDVLASNHRLRESKANTCFDMFSSWIISEFSYQERAAGKVSDFTKRSINNWMWFCSMEQNVFHLALKGMERRYGRLKSISANSKDCSIHTKLYFWAPSRPTLHMSMVMFLSSQSHSTISGMFRTWPNLSSNEKVNEIHIMSYVSVSLVSRASYHYPFRMCRSRQIN